MLNHAQNKKFRKLPTADLSQDHATNTAGPFIPTDSIKSPSPRQKVDEMTPLEAIEKKLKRKNVNREKHELFKNPNTTGQLPKMVNNRDQELRPEGRIDLTVMSDRIFLQFERMMEPLKMDMFMILVEFLKFQKGDISLEECNERLCIIQRQCIEIFGKKTLCWFTKQDVHKDAVWFDIPGRNPTNLIQEPLNAVTNAMENSMSILLEEEEEIGAAIRVFFCDECEIGTSYCSKMLDKQSGKWLCNLCSHLNDGRTNRYYIYNKADVGLISYLKYGSRTIVVQAYNNEFRNPKSDEIKKMKYSESKNKEYKREFAITGTRYSCNIQAQPVMRSLSNGKVDIDYSKRYFPEKAHEGVSLILCCEEVSLDDKPMYLFYLKVYRLPPSHFGLFSDTFRLMILPAFKDLKGKYPVDELLAVMHDNLQNLTFCGIKLTSAVFGENFKVNIVNFSCTNDLQRIFHERVKKTKLTHLANTEQKLVPDFGSILYGIIGRLVLGECLKLLCPRARKLLEKELDNSNKSMDEFVAYKDFQLLVLGAEFQHPRAKLAQKIKEIKVEELNNHEILLIIFLIVDSDKKGIHDSIQPSLMKMLKNIRRVFKPDSAIDHANSLKPIIVKLIQGYNDLCYTNNLTPDGGIDELDELLPCLNYFGDVQSLNYQWLWPEEREVIQKSHSYKKHINILNSINKSQVLFHNYMNLVQRYYLQCLDVCDEMANENIMYYQTVVKRRLSLLDYITKRRAEFEDYYEKVKPQFEAYLLNECVTGCFSVPLCAPPTYQCFDFDFKGNNNLSIDRTMLDEESNISKLSNPIESKIAKSDKCDEIKKTIQEHESQVLKEIDKDSSESNLLGHFEGIESKLSDLDLAKTNKERRKIQQKKL